jgi:predicted nucleic acid-binding protein
MIFIDSWVFIEFFSEGARFEGAKKIIQMIRTGEDAIISTAILTELKYRIGKKYDRRRSDEVIHTIQIFPNIKILPITTEVATLAADLRLKYYDKEKRPLSFIDVINLATAILSKCRKFYSGDPDFKDIEEIETMIL